MGYLRTLLAVSVIFAHSRYHEVFVGGRLAVQIFYMISGFLIGYVLRSNPTYADPMKFYFNRALRIYPVYYVVALLALVFALTCDSSVLDVYRNIPMSARAMLAISNLTIFGQDWVMFSGVHAGQLMFFKDFRASDVQLWRGLLVPQAWTLGVELSFYLIAPFVVRNTRLTLALLGLSVLVRLVTIGLGFGLSDPWNYRFFPSELSFFLIGSLSSQFLLPFWKRVAANHESWRLPSVATACLMLLCIAYMSVPVPGKIKNPILVLSCVVLLPLLFLYRRDSKFHVWIGELSYPVYICHQLLLWIIDWAVARSATQLTGLQQALVGVVGALAMAAALNAWVSTPIEKVRNRVRANRLAVRRATL